MRVRGPERLVLSMDQNGSAANFLPYIFIAHSFHNLMMETNEVEKGTFKLLEVQNVGLFL